MKLFYDLLPIAIFFIAYKLYGIFAASAAIIATVVVQIGLILCRGKRPEMMQLITLGVVVILGGATLLFKDEMFIKWKPTVVYWLLGVVFAGSQWVVKKNLVQKMFEKTLILPSKIWSTLNMTWYSFFFFMGIVNLIVVYSFDTDTWVNFKLFGTLILTVLFVLIQGLIISKHLPKQDQKM